MGAECFGRIKTLKPTGIEVCNPNVDGLSECIKASRGFHITVFDQAQAFTQHFAGILVTA